VALVLDATVGGPNANTYVTLAEAEAYVERMMATAAWTSATEQEKIVALGHAARRLDQEVFLGQRATTTQALQWPRAYVADPVWPYQALPSTTIPEAIQAAQVVLAVELLEAAATEAVATPEPAMSHITVGPITVEYEGAAAATAAVDDLPSEVYRLLRGFLSGGYGQFAILRG
jgi:hypothetical protein